MQIHQSAPSILVRRMGALGDVLEATAIVRRLKEENPDCAIDVQTHYPAVFLGNADVRHCGPSIDLGPHLTHTRFIDLDMAFEKVLRRKHPIDAYSQVAFGDEKTPHRLVFAVAPPLGPKAHFIAMHPAISWPIRTLPRQWWQDLVFALKVRGFPVVVTGTMQDHQLDGVSDFRGRLSLAEQAGLISRANCFVCSESGPMILAQTTATPVVALQTMGTPARVVHDRGDGATFDSVQAAIPCAGCEEDQPEAVTYFDCKFGHRNCVNAFDVREVAGLVLRRATGGDPVQGKGMVG